MHRTGQDTGVLDAGDAEAAGDLVGVPLQFREEPRLLEVGLGAADSEDQSSSSTLEVDATDHRSFLQVRLEELESVVIDVSLAGRVDDKEGAKRSEEQPVEETEQYQRQRIAQEYDGEQHQ